MAYEVRIVLTEEEVLAENIVIKVDTKGQAKKVAEAMAGHNVEVTQKTEKVVTF